MRRTRERASGNTREVIEGAHAGMRQRAGGCHRTAGMPCRTGARGCGGDRTGTMDEIEAVPVNDFGRARDATSRAQGAVSVPSAGIAEPFAELPASGPVCRCGADWHPDGDRCIRGHPRPGTPGPALTHGARSLQVRLALLAECRAALADRRNGIIAASGTRPSRSTGGMLS